MRRHFRLVLPLFFGGVDAVLMLWDIYNQRVISSVGMGWDTGAPLWPYQTPDTLLFALNFPAYVVAVPLERLLHMYVPWHYFVLFPAILFWWWLAGYALDRGVWRTGRVGWPWWSVAVISILAFAIAGTMALHDATVWWNRYCRSVFTTRNIIMLRASAPGLWSLVFAAAAAMFAKRRFPVSG